jgi:hypothetical protein
MNSADFLVAVTGKPSPLAAITFLAPPSLFC